MSLNREVDRIRNQFSRGHECQAKDMHFTI